jgi:hypothetical protein
MRRRGASSTSWNYQDPVDGRFVYRGAFREFINKSGGRGGEGAVENFEKVVLLSPQPPTKGVDFSKADKVLALPKTVAELDPVWKEWTIALRDEQSGKSFPDRPWLAWARAALLRKDFEVAKEQLEKGLVATPDQVDLLLEFGKLLASPRYKNNDRATKLGLRAAQLVERAPKVDDAKLKEVDHFLASVDPKRATLERIQVQLEAAAKGLAERYLAAQRPMMAMDISWRLGTELDMPALFDVFERAAKSSGRSLALWKLAYNEKNLDGWIAGTTAFHADGAELVSKFGDPKTDKYDYEFLTCDTVTSGDYSFEAELLAENELLSFAGLVFGKKASSTFHSLFYFPGRKADPTTASGAQRGVDPSRPSTDGRLQDLASQPAAGHARRLAQAAHRRGRHDGRRLERRRAGRLPGLRQPRRAARQLRPHHRPRPGEVAQRPLPRAQRPRPRRRDRARGHDAAPEGGGPQVGPADRLELRRPAAALPRSGEVAAGAAQELRRGGHLAAAPGLLQPPAEREAPARGLAPGGRAEERRPRPEGDLDRERRRRAGAPRLPEAASAAQPSASTSACAASKLHRLRALLHPAIPAAALQAAARRRPARAVWRTPGLGAGKSGSREAEPPRRAARGAAAKRHLR